MAPDGTVILAPTEKLKLHSSVLGEDYYDRITDLVERINRRETSVEAAAADKYRRAVAKAMQEQHFQPENFNASARIRKKAKTTRVSILGIDDGWKEEGRRRFPKKTSSIGEEVSSWRLTIVVTLTSAVVVR